MQLVRVLVAVASLAVWSACRDDGEGTGPSGTSTNGSSDSTSTTADGSDSTGEPSLCGVQPIIDVNCGTIVETDADGCGDGGTFGDSGGSGTAGDPCAETEASNHAVRTCVSDAKARGLGYSYRHTRDFGGGYESTSFSCRVQSDGMAWVNDSGSHDLQWWRSSNVYQGSGECGGILLEVCVAESGEYV